MFVAIGFVVVFGSLLLGYAMHGGHIAVLVQISEFVIIGGAGLGALLIANGPRVNARIVRETFGLLKADPHGEEARVELLQLLYELFYAARKNGLVSIEADIESPQTSAIFTKYPRFLEKEHAVHFLTDTLKVLLTGAIDDHHLAEILDLDLEQHHENAMEVPHALDRIADAMPGFGIVAAVLGVVITMGHIGGDTHEIGRSIAAALVGTFLGVFLAYGVFHPLAQAIEARVKSEASYLGCIRTALLSFSRGDTPITSVEFARRNIEPEGRPSFAELETMMRRGA